MVRILASSLIVASALLLSPAQAGFGIGGCPSWYLTEGYYSAITDGTYYQNYYDAGYWSFYTLYSDPLEHKNKVSRK
jgi:hypothetical protein